MSYLSPPSGIARADVLIRAKVGSVHRETPDINLIELLPTHGPSLPGFSAGSHVDLHLENGMVRSYSLANSARETHRYLIGVKREADGRGGSRFVHEELRAGDNIAVSAPRNNFKLNERAPLSVLIAGGIGITPLVSMALQLEELGVPWQMHYAARSRESAAFTSQLATHGEKVRYHFSSDPASGRLDIESIVRKIPDDAHIYGCGPEGLLAQLAALGAQKPLVHIHVEHFANAAGVDTQGEFEVVLAKSGQTINIPTGKTILDVLLGLGVDAQFSCLEGVCSSCETRVISGIPDHRDLILSEEERAANDRILICCSRSKSRRLILDL